MIHVYNVLAAEYVLSEQRQNTEYEYSKSVVVTTITPTGTFKEEGACHNQNPNQSILGNLVVLRYKPRNQVA
jgi:hypothetical protein